MQNKPTPEKQPAPQRKRSLTPQERAKVLARIVDVILADPGKQTTQEEPPQGDASAQHSAH